MRLDASAHPNKIESIIVRGWDLEPFFNLRLSMFLEQLGRLDGLQHLVLALPCGGVSGMILGRLTRLRSLRMCADVSHRSEVSCNVAPPLWWLFSSFVVAFHTRCQSVRRPHVRTSPSNVAHLAGGSMHMHARAVRTTAACVVLQDKCPAGSMHVW